MNSIARSFSVTTAAPATGTPTLTLSATSPSIASNAAAGTLVSNIGNVPAGATPTVTPNDGRLVIAGDASAGWKVVVGMSALSAGTVNFSVAATGATGASGVLTVTVAPNLPNVSSINGFGSSSIVGTGSTTTGNRFLNKVATALNATTIRNNGIGGTVVQASNDATGSPMVDNGRGRFVANVLGANISDLTILMWPNDLRYTGNPSVFNVAGYVRDMREIINGMIIAGIPAAGILLCSPTWYDSSHYAIGGTGFTGSTDAINVTYQQATLDLAKEYGTFYADIYTAIRDNGGLSLFVSGDVHWNDAGHQVAATAALAATRPNTTAKITTLTGTSTVPGQLDITGSAVSGAASYEVQIDVAAGYTYSGGSANPATPSASFTGLTQGNGYKYRARAVFGDGTKSAWTFGASAVTIASSSGTTAFFNDTFTGTTGDIITAHTSDTGHTWALQSGTTSDVTPRIDANRLRGPGTTGAWRAQITAPTADYDVDATIDWLTSLSTDNVAICGRMQAAANTFYWARFSNTVGGFELYKMVAGVSTKLGATYTDAFTSGSRDVRLRMQGSTISFYVADMTAPKITVTDADITGPGSPGFRSVGSQTTGTGREITSLKATAL